MHVSNSTNDQRLYNLVAFGELCAGETAGLAVISTRPVLSKVGHIANYISLDEPFAAFFAV
jgi:hypothetical protein